MANNFWPNRSILGSTKLTNLRLQIENHREKGVFGQTILKGGEEVAVFLALIVSSYLVYCEPFTAKKWKKHETDYYGKKLLLSSNFSVDWRLRK